MVLEDGQDASSLEQQEGLEISSTNTASYVDGSGNNWVVEILNRGSGNNWDTIGDLSSAGSDWSTVSLVVESPDITDYLDSAFNDEMLVRVISPSDSQLAYKW